MILASVGGSGSLGLAILRQQELLRDLGVTKIRILSRDDQKHVAILRNYAGKIPLDCCIGDITDRERMFFGLRDAHYVVHSAALKHVDRFELDVPTGYKSNIVGTENVADAFMASPNAVAGAFTSTDKSADPQTAYGASKLAAEFLWKWHNSYQSKVKMVVTRYGNVWGSRGSAIEIWTELAKRKVPFKITDPLCTRFFMRIDDAAKLVLSALRSDKTLHIPEMKSASMLDVAETIWSTFNSEPLKYELTGFRGVEKLHEILESGGLSSFEAPRFSKSELRELYREWLASSQK